MKKSGAGAAAAVFALVIPVVLLWQGVWTIQATKAYANASLSEGRSTNEMLVNVMDGPAQPQSVTATGTVVDRVWNTQRLHVLLQGAAAGRSIVVTGSGLTNLCAGDAVALRGTYENVGPAPTLFVASGDDVFPLPFHNGHLYVLNFLRRLTGTCDR